MAYVVVKTLNSIPKILATVDAARHRAVLEGTNKIHNHSQHSVPVDTGKLRASVKQKVVDSTATTTGNVSYNTDYAIYVELGTSRMAAQPYLHPAFLVGRDAMIMSLVNWLRVA